jgi:hypothetical protein
MDSQATDTLERVRVADSPAPAAADEDPAPTPRSLKQRLAAIRDESFGIGKDTIKMKSKAGVEFTIKGHTVEAVLSEMRPLLAKHGVDITPTLVERTYTGNRCDVLIDFLFERTDDSDETRTIRWAGAGTDDGDKGFSKAGTNALKEMLKKRFLITDRDDAKEEEEKVEHRAEGGATRAQVDDAHARAEGAIQQWATAFKGALENARTEKEVGRLQAENAQQLNDAALPAVTRQFFFDLIQRRKSELAPK